MFRVREYTLSCIQQGVDYTALLYMLFGSEFTRRLVADERVNEPLLF